MSLQFLKQSTNSQVVVIGPIVLASDGTTTFAASLTAGAISIRKEGGTSFVPKNSGGGTLISGGVYHATLNSSDTDTIGKLEIFTFISTYFATKDKYHVLAANVYDSIVTGAGADLLDVSVTQLAGSTTAGTAIKNTALAAVVGTAVTGTLTTGSCTSSLGSAYATDSALIGRQIIFLGDVTTALTGQAGTISAYNGTSKLITFSTLTTAPANLDSFVIV